MSRALLTKIYIDCDLGSKLNKEVCDYLAKHEPEPVAWMYDYTGFKEVKNCVTTVKSYLEKLKGLGYAENIRNLYTYPPDFNRLSDEDIYILKRDTLGGYFDFARAIETALIEKTNKNNW